MACTNSEERKVNEGHKVDEDAWLRMHYQLAHSDIRWGKEQGWRVVHWTLLLYGALLWLVRVGEISAPLPC